MIAIDNWERLWSRLRIFMWGGAALLLLLPLIAMRFTSEVNWTAFDFAVFGAILAIAGAACEIAARTAGGWWSRAALGFTIAIAFFFVWVSLGVGIIGGDGDPANMLFLPVAATLLIGAIIARLKPSGMVVAMLGVILVHVLITAIAFALKLGHGSNEPPKLLYVNAFFIVLWLGCAFMFWVAGRREDLLCLRKAKKAEKDAATISLEELKTKLKGKKKPTKK